MSDIIESELGFDDYRGRWYETYGAKIEGYVGVQSHPASISGDVFDWLAFGVLIDDEDDD